MPSNFDISRMGWLPDYPDVRDYTQEHPEVQGELEKAKVAGAVEALRLPPSKDLRAWCSPVEDQGNIGSCTAQAGVAILEYFQRKAFNKHIDGSRLFLYKATRNLLGWTGDTGAFLRSTMGAMVSLGVPPERYWPYQTSNYDKEPPAFCYAFAQNYQAMKYYRLDPPNEPPNNVLQRVKRNLAADLPSMFGFTVYDSIWQVSGTGKIPYPAQGDAVAGGHAVLAVGYDDSMKIKNPAPGSKATTGAFLIRNSWGSNWGDNGYGWLPYDYLLSGLADDWWSLVKAEWFDTGNFGL